MSTSDLQRPGYRNEMSPGLFTNLHLSSTRDDWQYQLFGIAEADVTVILSEGPDMG